MNDHVWLCLTTVYDYACVSINLSDFSWPCTTMCDSVLLLMTLYFLVWLCLTLEDSIGHCMTLHDPVWLCITLYDSEWIWMTLFESVSLTLSVFWFLGSMLPQYMALSVSLSKKKFRQSRRLRFGMLTVLTNIRSTKVLHHASCIMHHRLLLNKVEGWDSVFWLFSET